MWRFLRSRIRRLFWLVVVARVVALAARLMARELERRHRGATTTSRTLVWIGNALPRATHMRVRL